ncbi:MAG: glycosyltransferase [Lentisphaerota bacterium]
MSRFFNEIQYFLTMYWNYEDYWKLYVLVFPIVIFLEIPLYMIIIVSYIKKFWNEVFLDKVPPHYFPTVSCIITCYNEGQAIVATINTLVEQLYRGNIEILVMVDGSDINKSTYDAAHDYATKYHSEHKNTSRYIQVIPKKLRGGRVSSNNLGLSLAKGEIIIIIDGDCSVDNDLIASAVRGFADPNVVGSSGNIRVRNANKSLVAKFQAIEYMIGLQLSKTGLAEIGMLNNISGAHGIFRKSFVKAIGGWKNGTAEDLDMTTRIKVYLKQYPNLKIIHSYEATMHTDVPETWKVLLKQRLRWDGDLSFLYFKRYRKALRPMNIGWKNLFAIIWYDFFFCLCVPFLTIIYTIWLYFRFSPSFATTMFILTYIYYLFSTTVLFALYLAFVSERKGKDFKFIIYIPLMPFYQYIMRIWTAFATICEFTLSTHKDTNMAPWWVIRKT